MKLTTSNLAQVAGYSAVKPWSQILKYYVLSIPNKLVPALITELRNQVYTITDQTKFETHISCLIIAL